MNSDLPSGCPGARDTTPNSPGICPQWRVATNLHASLFADGPEPTPSDGEIWSIRHPLGADADLVLAAITAVDDDTVAVVPLSTTVDDATEWDLVLPLATLGYPAIVQPKLAGIVASDRLEQRLSALMPESRRDLAQLLAISAAGKAIPPENLPVGPWVLSENDPRLTARVSTADRLAGYFTLVHDDPISEWRSLGSIIMRGSRATGIDLATVLDQPRWASRLQADQLNPFAMLPARKMAELLKTLRIGWTERVRDAMYGLASQYTPSDIPTGTVFGRRQGTRARRAAERSPPKSGTDAAIEYVNDVKRELDNL
jgi:hypothetical protein